MTDATARLTTALAARYRIEGELGQGGMATVYLAQDLRHDRQVANKVLRPELAAVLGVALANPTFAATVGTPAALRTAAPPFRRSTLRSRPCRPRPA
jgi:serine/threonine-protein kinase